MAEITVVLERDGIQESDWRPAAVGDWFANRFPTVVFFRYTGTVDVVATAKAAKPCQFGFAHDEAITIPAAPPPLPGEEPDGVSLRKSRSFDPIRFGTTVHLEYSAVDRLEVVCVREENY